MYKAIETLPEEVRDKIFEDDLFVFAPSCEVHPILSLCSVNGDSIEDEDMLRVCKHFEFEEDYSGKTPDNTDSITCMHCYANGYTSYCEKFIDIAALKKEGFNETNICSINK